MRGLLFLLISAIFPFRAQARPCVLELAVGLSGYQRAANEAMLAEAPAANESEVRTALAEAVDARSKLVSHGRGTLPRAVRVDEARGVLAEVTRLAHAGDLAGMRRLLEDPRTEARLGARIDRRTPRIATATLLANGLSGVARLEAFADLALDGPTAEEQNSTFVPEADRARFLVMVDLLRELKMEPPAAAEPRNTLVLPVGVDWRSSDAFPAERFQLLRRETERFLCLACWEEVFHQVDWAVWTATGESASPSTNRLLGRLRLPYEFWAYAELSVFLQGTQDGDLLVGDEPERRAFHRVYPALRHRIGHSPALRGLLE